LQRFTQTVSTLTAAASILRRRNRHETMHLPALTYKQLAARAGDGMVPVRAPLVRVVPLHPAPVAANAR